MSDSKKTKVGLIGTLLIVLVAIVGIFGLLTLCKNILKDGKVEYIMDMGLNSGSGKDASLAGDKGYEDTEGRYNDGEEGTSLLDLYEQSQGNENGNSNNGGRNEDYLENSMVQAVPGGSGEDYAIGDEGSSGEAGSDLNSEEIDSIVSMAKYLASTESYMGVALDEYNLPMNDEIVMKAIEIISNDHMSNISEATPYVVPNTYDGGVMTVSKADIDAYAKNVFGYEGIASYSYAGIQDNGDTCDIWCHQGTCDSFSSANDWYMEGDAYVVTGMVTVNAGDLWEPYMVEVEYTLKVRRNSDSPFGFTFLDMQFGTANPVN